LTDLLDELARSKPAIRPMFPEPDDPPETLPPPSSSATPDDGLIRVFADLKELYGLWQGRINRKETNLTFEQWLRKNNIFNGILPR
jgi:hypothetical protein